MTKKKALSIAVAAVTVGVASVAAAGTYASQWSLQSSLDVDLIQGHDKNLAFTPAAGGPVVIGLVDTGIDYRLPELADAVWTNPGEIPGNCIDDDENGYIDDVHGIRVDVRRSDDLLESRESGALAAAFAESCVAHLHVVDDGVCVPPGTEPDEQGNVPPQPDAADIVAVAGLNAAYARAITALEDNPFLYDRGCANGYGATDVDERAELAAGDPLDFWYGHGTLMAATMGARSGNPSEPASLLDLPDGQGGKLGDHVQIVTCAAGFMGNVKENGKEIWPRGTVEGAVECADYFLALKASGVNIVAVNLSLGMATSMNPFLGYFTVAEDARLDGPAVQLAMDRLEGEDILVAAAAHNFYDPIDDTAEHAMYPAAFENDAIVGVGGVNERGAWFGNRGRTTIDVAAPAQRIIHATPGADLVMTGQLVVADGHLKSIAPAPGADYVAVATWGDGTSQATAYVSTVVAILGANASTAGLTPAETRRLLMSSGSTLPSLPYMLILRPAPDASTQAGYWLAAGMFEPQTRTTKQAELSASSRSGRIVRLDRALDCQATDPNNTFHRIVAPVQRQVVPGQPIPIEAESYTCASPTSVTSIDVVVTKPDGTTANVTLTSPQGDGYFIGSYSPATAGSYAFALASATNDTLTVQVSTP